MGELASDHQWPCFFWQKSSYVSSGLLPFLTRSPGTVSRFPVFCLRGEMDNLPIGNSHPSPLPRAPVNRATERPRGEAAPITPEIEQTLTKPRASRRPRSRPRDQPRSESAQSGLEITPDPIALHPVIVAFQRELVELRQNHVALQRDHAALTAAHVELKQQTTSHHVAHAVRIDALENRLATSDPAAYRSQNPQSVAIYLGSASGEQSLPWPMTAGDSTDSGARHFDPADEARAEHAMPALLTPRTKAMAEELEQELEGESNADTVVCMLSDSMYGAQRTHARCTRVRRRT